MSREILFKAKIIVDFIVGNYERKKTNGEKETDTENL